MDDRRAKETEAPVAEVFNLLRTNRDFCCDCNTSMLPWRSDSHDRNSR